MADPLAGSRRSQSGWKKERGGRRSRIGAVGLAGPVGRGAAPRPSPGPVPVGEPTEDGRLDAIELRGIAHTFAVDGAPLSALDGIDVTIGSGEVVAIVGPNGCGKSTLLRIVGGLVRPTDGEAIVHGERVAAPSTRVGIVFQEPRLLPWRPTLANVAYALELAGVDGRERTDRARAAMARLGLDGFEAAYPDELSGGMAQRAALARAVVAEPDVLLLDEPFSALDALTRERLDLELLSLWEEQHATIILVTHSIPEAVLVADRVLVLSPRPGRIVADVLVESARPRTPADLDGPALGAAAAAVRSALDAGEVVAA